MNRNRLLKAYQPQIITAIISFFITTGIYLQLLAPTGANGKRIIWMLILIGSYALIRCIQKKESGIGPREKKYAAVLAAVYSFLLILGYVIQANSGFDHGIKNHLIDLISFLGLFFAFYYCLIAVFGALVRNRSKKVCVPHEFAFLQGKKAFFVSWGIIFLSWLLYLVICYPGLPTFDSYAQIGEALSGNFSNWQPIIHTWLILPFVRLGKHINNMDFGVFLYSFTQMVLFSAICAYSIFFMRKKSVRPVFCLIVLLYFAIFPINALLGITMWKDILFSGITLLLILFLFSISDNPGTFFSSWKNIVGLILILFLFCTFRNNGLFAFLVFLPFFFIVQHRYWKQVLIVCCSCLLLVAAYKGPVFQAFHVTETPSTEAMSVPLQQIARTVKFHKATLTKDEIQRINEILPVDKLPDLYNPQLSDPVKNVINAKVLLQNKNRYSSLWLDLFKKYPKTYLESFLANSYGYWYPDVDFTINTFSAGANQFGITAVKHPGMVRILEKVVGHGIPATPGISMLCSIGFAVWILLFLCALCLYQKQAQKLLPFILLFTLWLTVMASPVFAEYRYAYGLILSCPICLGICLFQSGESAESGAADDHRAKS